MDQAKSSMERFYNALYNMEYLEEIADEKPLSQKEENYKNEQQRNSKRFIQAMDDDFNTADAISALFDIVRAFNTDVNEDFSKQTICFTKDLLLSLGQVLGLFREFADKSMLDEEIEQKIKERQEARQARNFELADKIRDELMKKGIVLEDTSTGVRWKRK